MYDWGSRVDPLYTFTYHLAYVFLHRSNLLGVMKIFTEKKSKWHNEMYIIIQLQDING